MSTNNLRPVSIGVVSYSLPKPGEEIIEEQYIISDEDYAELKAIFESHGAIVSQIEARGNLYESFDQADGKIDILFNLAQDLYQVGVPMVIEQLKLEKKRKFLEYTGARFEGHALALNKAVARQVLYGKVAQPDWWFLEDENTPLPEGLTFPIIVKPVNESHSIGIQQSNVVFSREELEATLAELRTRIGGAMLMESFLDGDEYSMGIVGNVIFPSLAWNLDDIPGKPLVRGEDMKQGDLTTPHAQYVRDPELMLALAKQVATAHSELGLLDYSRTDFRAKKGAPDPYFIEVNSGCGLRNHHSLLPMAAAKAGVSYSELIASIAAQALQRLDADHRTELDTRKFDATFSALLEKAKSQRVIEVKGRTFFVMAPLD